MISVIIPNYNGLEHLKICLGSLLGQSFKEFTVIVVDNGSTDGSENYVRENFTGFLTIQMGENSGFSRAVNEGIRYSLKNLDSEYIMLLNNDIELDRNFLKYAAETFRNIPEASFIATKMLNYYNRGIIDDCGDFIKANGGSPLARGHSEKDSGQYDKEEFIFGACAGASLYKAELFEKTGLLDEKFFAYYEDIDLSFRAQLMGFKCFYQPKAVCYHKRGGTSSVATHGFQTEMCERNLLLMRFKNYPLMIYILYQPLFFLARLKRYYAFLRFHPASLLFRALRGYLRGLFMIPGYIGARIKIQKTRKITDHQVRSLFIK